MSVLVLLCGVQGSGKSTFARSLADRLEVTLVSTDSIRQELTGEYGGVIPSQTPLVMKMAKEKIRKALKTPQRVVLYDATNTTRKARRPFVTLAQGARACVAAGYFPVSLNVAMTRVKQRTDQAHVPLQTVRQTHSRFAVPARSEGFDWIFNGSAIAIDECAEVIGRLALATPEITLQPR